MNKFFSSIVVFFVILFIYGRLPQAPVLLDNADRAYMRMRIRELNEADAKTEEWKAYRLRFNGMSSEIGDGTETWYDRYYMEMLYHRSLRNAFQESLRLGVKIAPPEQFKNTIGYDGSPDKAYFTN